MASHTEPTEESNACSKQVSFTDRKTGTEYAADGTVINTTDPYLHDDRTADDIPMVDTSSDEHGVPRSNNVLRVDLSQGHNPTPSSPAAASYGVQNQVPWIISQPPNSSYVYNQQPLSTQMAVVRQERVPDYSNWSLFVCLCCCWPLGWVAVNKAGEAKELENQGRYAEAKEKANEAKKYSILGFVVGIIVIIIGIGILVWQVTSAQKTRRY